MDENLEKDVKYILEKIKPYIALAVLIFIVISTVNLIKYNNLQKEVKASCGYDKGEDVYCICDKQFVSNNYVPGNPYINETPYDYFGSIKLQNT